MQKQSKNWPGVQYPLKEYMYNHPDSDGKTTTRGQQKKHVSNHHK